MRKRVFNIAVLAAAAGIIAACSSYEEIPAAADLSKAEVQAVDSITVTFSATLGQPGDTTRTSLDVSNWRVKWTAGDKVTVIGKGTYKSGQTTNTLYFPAPGTVSDISDDGYSATISASLPSKTSNETITYTGEYYAVYPVISTTSSSTSANVSTALISEQNATPESFANNVNISAAKATSTNSFQFKNLCALLSFTVDTDIVSATLTSNSQTPMSGGTATISFSGDNPTMALSVSDLSSSVKLTGEIKKGKKYYFVVYPGVYSNGFTIEFEDKDGKTASMSSSKKLELAAKNNVFLGDIKVPADRWTKLNKISTVGVYDTDCKVEYEYKTYYDQLVWSVSSGVNGFRIQKMDTRQFLNITGLPGTFTVGDTFSLSVNENLLTDQGSEFTDKVKVFSTDNGIVRLKGEKHNYIIQTK